MNIQKPLAVTGERSITQLLAQAEEILRSGHSAVPDGFAAGLFERASLEDL